MPAKSTSEQIVREYSVTWGGTSVGYVKNVDLSGLQVKTIEKKIGEVGDIKIDDVIVGMEGTVKITLHQVMLATYRQLILQAPGSGSIPGIPETQYQSLYSLANTLNIHPKDMGADLSEDFNILKATPKLILPKSSEGKEFMTLDTEWMVYPDQAQLLAEPPVLRYFWIGEVPA